MTKFLVVDSLDRIIGHVWASSERDADLLATDTKFKDASYVLRVKKGDENYHYNKNGAKAEGGNHA